GMRAVTIQASNECSAPLGLVRPGNRVDVLLIVSGSGGNHPPGSGSTITLLQNVEILAVDQRVESAGGFLGRCTLLVTPIQAPMLDLGQNKRGLNPPLLLELPGSRVPVVPTSSAPFKIDPNTPPKDLLPAAPEVRKSAGPVLAEDLARVPEV